MRPVVVLLAAAALSTLGGCSIFGGGGSTTVPEGDGWRQQVVEAVAATPGVSRHTVTVNDVDSGLGRTGPVITGGVVVEGDAQAVVDDLLRRISDVLGRESAGVRVSFGVSEGGAPAKNLRDYGYGGVRDGRSLWDATH